MNGSANPASHTAAGHMSTHRLILNSLTSRRSFMYCTDFIHWSVAMWLQCRSETVRCYCLAQGYLGTHNSGGPEHSCVLQLWDDFSDNRPSEHDSEIRSLEAWTVNTKSSLPSGKIKRKSTENTKDDGEGQKITEACILYITGGFHLGF